MKTQRSSVGCVSLAPQCKLCSSNPPTSACSQTLEPSACVQIYHPKVETA